MPGPTTQKITRQFIAKLASTTWLRNRLFRSEDFGFMLALAAGVANNDDITVDPVSLAALAFAVGSENYEHNLSYKENNFEDCYDGGEDDDCILHVQRIKRTDGDRKRITTIGCFDSVEMARNANVESVDLGISEGDVAALVADFVNQSKRKRKSSDDKLQEKIKQLEDTNSALKEEINQLKKRPLSASTKKQVQPQPKRSQQPKTTNTTNDNSDPMDIDEDAEEKPTTLYYVLNGEGGELEMKTDDNIDLEDLKANITRDHLTAGDIMSEKAKKRTETYSFTRVNGVDSISPNGVTPVMTCYLSRLQNQAQKVKDIKDMFKKKQCAFTATMMRYIIAARIMYAMSDQTVAMMTFMVIKVMNDHFGLGLTNDEIGNGTACGSTYANYEAKVAVECQMAVLEEMKKVEFWAMGQDAGNKKGMEHLIKVITYPIFDKNSNVIAYGRFCLDMDVSGKTSDEVAAAIIKTIERFQKHVEGTCIAITGDSGGGGGVQRVFPDLSVAIPTIERYIRCLLHAHNKCLERAIIHSSGSAGIGKNAGLQLSYNVINMHQMIKSELEKSGYDELVRVVCERFRSRQDWIDEATTVLGKFHTDELCAFLDKIKTTQEDLREDTADIGCSGIEKPHLNRWQSTLPAIDLICRNPVFHYFMAVVGAETARKRRKGSHQSLLEVVCLDVIALFKLTSEVDTDDETMADGNTVSDDRPPSVLLMQLLFIDAFAKCVYNNMFTLTCQATERFGPSSHSHISGDCVLRAYIMYKQISDLLAEGGLANHTEFNTYLKELQRFPKLGDVKKCGREYIEKMALVFLEEYMNAYKEHVVQPWTSNEIVVYLLACSNPEVVHLFAKYLYYLHNNSGTNEDAEGNYINVADGSSFTWPKGKWQLPGHSVRSDGKELTEVNIKECMEFLTKNVDVAKILDDPIIVSCKDDLWKLAQAEEPVDILDKASWGEGNDYTFLYKAVTERILIHTAHNQGVESYVLAAAKVRSTNVGEKRASYRIIIESYLNRRFNIEALAAKRDKQTDKSKKDKVQRPKDKERCVGFGNKVDELTATLDKMKARNENKYDEMFKSIFADLTSKDDKISKDMQDKKLNQYTAATQAERKVVAGETKKEGVLVTPAVGKTIKTSFLRAGEKGPPSHDSVLRAELKAREKEFDDKTWKKMAWKKKISELKELELRNMATKEGGATKANGTAMQVGDVKEVDPVSNELKALLGDHNQWLSGKRNK